MRKRIMQAGNTRPPERHGYTLAALLCLILIAGIFAAAPVWAQAQFAPNPAQCTSDPAFVINYPSAGTGIISVLVNNISSIIFNVSAQLYNNIIGDTGFQTAVKAAMTIYIAVFGIMFMLGMTQGVFMDFIVRCIKIGIVAALITPNSFNYFYSYVGVFFNDGTNWLIGVMANIALGTSVQGMNANAPFAVLDNALATITSTKMIVTCIAIISTGPYGIIIGLMVLAAIVKFSKTVFEAIWVYLMSMVIRAFLFALAPIFFSFLLFQRTRHMFDGWVNALVSSMLQPVFMFAFFAFFAQLVTGAMMNLVNFQWPSPPPVCWTPINGMNGIPTSMEWWRYEVPFCVNGICGWTPYNGDWSFTGPNLSPVTVVINGVNTVMPMPVFPLDITNILIMVGLVYVMSSFVSMVPNLAKEIVQSHLALNVSGGMGQFMGPLTEQFKKTQDAAGKVGDEVAGRRPAPQVPPRPGQPPQPQQPGGGQPPQAGAAGKNWYQLLLEKLLGNRNP